MRPPALIALESIDRAIRQLSEPTGSQEEYGPTKLVYGGPPTPTYRAGNHLRGIFNPNDPEVVKVREALIGSAFAVAQAHAVLAPINPGLANVRHVANYWKHRDQWDQAWASGSHVQQATMAAMRALGASPPVALGQLEALVRVVLGCPFEAGALWRAIS